MNEIYLESDDIHFSVANDNLMQAIEDNPSLVDKLGLSQRRCSSS